MATINIINVSTGSVTFVVVVDKVVVVFDDVVLVVDVLL